MHKHLDNTNQIESENYQHVRNADAYLTIIAYNQEHGKIAELSNNRNSDKGLDIYDKAIEKARLIRANYIIVNELKTAKAPLSSPSAKYQIFIKPVVEKEENQDQKTTPHFQVPNYASEQFQGLGGLGELMNIKEALYKKEFEIQALKRDLEIVRDSEAYYKKQVDELDEENDKLESNNNKLIEENERLSKYEPQNATIFGLNPVAIGSAIAQRVVSNIATKNPEITKSYLGMTDEQFNSFFGQNVIAPPPSKESNQSTQDVQFDDDENDNPNKTVIANIKAWLNQLNQNQLYLVASLFEAIAPKIDSIPQVIEFINSQTNTDK